MQLFHYLTSREKMIKNSRNIMTGRRGNMKSAYKTFYNEPDIAPEISIVGLKTANVLLLTEISRMKNDADEARQSQLFFNSIINSIRDPFCIFDNEYRIVSANKGYAEMKGMNLEDLAGRKCHELFHNRNAVCRHCLVEKTFRSSDPCAKEKQVRYADGFEGWLELYTYPILDDDGMVRSVIEYARDITERKRAEEQNRKLIAELRHLSKTDPLTGLLNRRAIIEGLEHEIERVKRHCHDLSLIFCDVDNFKQINDTYGHSVGDNVLRFVANMLNRYIRRIDLSGRYGGDEFMLVLPQTQAEGAEHLAQKIRLLFENNKFPLEDGSIIDISLSLGVAGYEKGIYDLDSLIKKADRALYISKLQRKNRTTLFSASC